MQCSAKPFCGNTVPDAVWRCVSMPLRVRERVILGCVAVSSLCVYFLNFLSAHVARVIVIGDVHGCADEMRDMLIKVVCGVDEMRDIMIMAVCRIGREKQHYSMSENGSKSLSRQYARVESSRGGCDGDGDGGDGGGDDGGMVVVMMVVMVVVVLMVVVMMVVMVVVGLVYGKMVGSDWPWLMSV